MRRVLLAVVVSMLSCHWTWADSPAPSLAEPWLAQYSGEQATGKAVIGLWQFNAGTETADASGHGHTARLEGGKWNPDGRFDGCLESGRGYPVIDKPHRVMVANRPDLSPPGAFTLEMWIKPTAEIKDYGESFLLDKKYVAHDDYQLILGTANPLGERVLRACLGFGADSATWSARPMVLQPGTWYHIAFTYDGQGTGSFFVNDALQGSTTTPGRKQISPGKHGLSIGDRIGSNFHGFPGLIDEVRISQGALEFRPAKLERVASRACFVRMEPNAAMLLTLSNLRRAPLAGAKLNVSVEGMANQEIKVSDLAAGASQQISVPLDTALRPGSYQLTARLNTSGPDPLDMKELIEYRIAPRRLPQFPVVMWGIYSPSGILEELPRLKQIGFTHAVGLGADFASIWKAGKPTDPSSADGLALTRRMLDEALANDFSVVASLSPGSYPRSQEKYQRINRQGKTPTDKKQADICGLFPEIETFCRNVGESVGKAYAQYPAFVGALIHTEVRDHAYPCFHPHDLEAYKKASGADIPPEVGGSHGVDYKKLKDFPASRVIPDNHPLYQYFRWYWKQGDGWNALNTAVHQGLGSGSGNRIWTFHDPAVRVARVYGSGGAVDYLSQWTYSYPDPIRIGLATDELLATAAGASAKQQVMKMTQIIWYRSQTAPQPKPGKTLPDYQAGWEQQQPGAEFITIPPMHLREAFWTKIARPIRGIMYHGWQSLVACKTQSEGSYRYTHPQTQHELARLTSQIVRPLGPTLLAVPGVKSDVAFLESFASEMFARRGTYGWCGGWAGDAYHVMLYAHLQPEIVLDETIVDRGLDGFRVLVMCDCDVITQKMAERIQAFQAKGGLIVGDDRIAPAIKPDIVIPTYARTGQADKDKAALLAIAAELRTKLDARYGRYTDTSDPEVIPYLRRHRDTDYVFVLNDHREFGNYVGQHGLVMENGVPVRAAIALARPEGFLYDLVQHRAIPARQEGGRLLTDLQFGPSDGRLLMATSRAIQAVRIQAPAETKPGQKPSCVVEVTDATGRRIDAVVPMEITIRDAEGAPAEFSGYHAAVDGQVTVALDIASNDIPGIWQIEAKELASGQKSVHYLRVTGPQPWPPARKPVPKELANPVQPKG